ncbi:MAG: cytochrome-c peroxidase [Candidatus Wallbacteria bacterium]|nr:cytochrome-c peroxidase [Candidatus Wallbacteria bacterium]
MTVLVRIACTLTLLACLACSPAHAGGSPGQAELEAANPVRALPAQAVGHDQALGDLPAPPDPQRARLGRWLFFDTRLSADGTVSCATCHRANAAFGDTAPVARGIRGRTGRRKAPSFINVAFAFFAEQFWDGRAVTLEEQARAPIANDREMGGSHDVAVRAIAAVAGYAPFFRRAFGTPVVTLERITAAIADYERTRISGNSPWDRWRRQGEVRAVSEEAKLGDRLFFGKARCDRCHVATVLTDPKFASLRAARAQANRFQLVGNSFTDWRFHNTGIGWDARAKRFADAGRFEVTKDPAHMGAFKTPGLRDVALHPPYMHDGSLPTLEAVVEHYRQGGIDNPYLDSQMEPLELTDAEARALVAFLKALNGEGYQDTPPALFPR